MGNKFRVIFYDFAGMDNPYVLTQQVRRVQLPRLLFEESETSEYTNIVFLDEVSGDLFKAIMVQAKAQKAKGPPFKMDIEILGSAPQRIIRRYTHTGCSIISVDPCAELNYEKADGIEFSLRVKYTDVVALIPIVKFEGFEQL